MIQISYYLEQYLVSFIPPYQSYFYILVQTFTFDIVMY